MVAGLDQVVGRVQNSNNWWLIEWQHELDSVWLNFDAQVVWLSMDNLNYVRHVEKGIGYNESPVMKLI